MPSATPSICKWKGTSANDPSYDDVIKWKQFPRYWPFVRGIHRSPVNSPHKGQWRGALMFSLICALNKRLSKQSWGWSFETPSRSLWRHCNEVPVLYLHALYETKMRYHYVCRSRIHSARPSTPEVIITDIDIFNSAISYYQSRWQIVVNQQRGMSHEDFFHMCNASRKHPIKPSEHIQVLSNSLSTHENNITVRVKKYQEESQSA